MMKRFLFTLATLLTLATPVAAQVTTQPTRIAPISTTLVRAATTPVDCSTPQFSFTGDTDTGVGYRAAGSFSLCVDGSNAAYASVSGLIVKTLILDSTNADNVFARVGAGSAMVRTSTGSSTATRFAWPNTWTNATNYEAFEVDWQTTANVALVGTRTAATGTARSLRLFAQSSNGANGGAAVNLLAGAPYVRIEPWSTLGDTTVTNVTGGAGNWVQVAGATRSIDTSGQINMFAITPTYNQTSGTAANTDLLINRTQTAVGSGAQLLIDAQVSTVSKFSVTNAGVVQASSSITSNTDMIAASRFILNSKMVINVTAPTVTSAGSSPSVTENNGTIAFRVNVGTGGAATTIVMSMPAAATNWNCNAENLTANAANRANQHVVQQSSTTTAVTVQNQTISTGAALAFTASDIVRFICVPE